MEGGINLWTFVQNNPIKWVDPTGLLNILFGGGVSVIAPTGGEGSVGIVINPGLGNDKPDIGVYGAVGTGGGVNVSADVFLGFIKGSISNVSGMTANINIVAGPISLTVIVDPRTNEIMGFTIGMGPTATPIGASGTISIAGTFTVRDLWNKLKKLLGEKTTKYSLCR